MRPISTNAAAPAGGHYSQAVAHGGLVFVSGQLPVARDGGHDPQAPFEAQARRALANLVAVLAAADAAPSSVLKVTVYIVGIERWPAFDAIYAEMFGAARPARSVVPVPALHHGYLIEIDAIACTVSAASSETA